MQTLSHLTTAGYVSAHNGITRFWRNQRGASVSTIMLIALLVVAVGGFAVVVQNQLTTAGNTVRGANFGN